MLDLAAPGDTLGIEGQHFLTAYTGALAVFIVVAIVLRSMATRAGGGTYPPQPTPHQVALLDGGPSRAVYSALAGLRAAGVIEAGEHRQLTVTGPAPARLTRLDRAVYDAARRDVEVHEIEKDTGVRAALAELADSVEQAGWLVGPSQRSKARLGAWLVLGLAALGVVGVMADIVNGKDVLFLVGLAFVAWLVGSVLLQVPRRSAAGTRAIATLRLAHVNLAPNQTPAWATCTGAAMGVALYGTASLWAADPAFAEDAGIRRATDDSSGDSGPWLILSTVPRRPRPSRPLWTMYDGRRQT